MAELFDIKDTRHYNEEQKLFINKYMQACGGFLPSCFEDPDFLSVFMKYIDKKDWDNYVLNTRKYLSGGKFDPQYVLVFRRTTPKQSPDSEVFWTYEYGVVRSLLKNEIPEHSEHRILSKIYVSTLKVLNELKETLEDAEITDKLYSNAASDGEIRISREPFDLNKKCLFAIKPKSEQNELEEYLQRTGLQYE